MRQAIQTKYLGPTNTLGARIKAWCYATAITVPYDYYIDTEVNHKMAAEKLMHEMGWDKDAYLVGGSSPSGDGHTYIQISKD